LWCLNCEFRLSIRTNVFDRASASPSRTRAVGSHEAVALFWSRVADALLIAAGAAMGVNCGTIFLSRQ